MNIKKIQEIVELMTENDLAEVNIEEEGTKVHIKKNGMQFMSQPMMQPMQYAQPQAMKQEQPSAASEAQIAGTPIKSPMVGTFYSAPSPDSEPYVKVGDTVKKGDVLCIVEAMKLMNEVKSEFSGKIVSILAENAEPIEFGQTLFIIQ
ncbi:MAG: acetyl-CoA carboxylase biotin carboxyl carrier protein [Candidatus Omnitrophica bacterium]|nr:acetyl-CoA carboxylase biotin carboxyl carrier protein [Candidatus Omnitrophota bacterium]